MFIIPSFMVSWKRRFICASLRVLLFLLVLGIYAAWLRLILKKAPRAWHARLGSFLRAHGFVPSTYDTSLFLLQRPEVTMYLLVYVDDIILISSSDAAADPSCLR
jgi:hypothetical protein